MQTEASKSLQQLGSKDMRSNSTVSSQMTGIPPREPSHSVPIHTARKHGSTKAYVCTQHSCV